MNKHKHYNTIIDFANQAVIDGTTLTNGEIALIKALRKANVAKAFKFKKTRLVTEENHRLYTYDNHVAFLTNGPEAVIAALKKIQEEQEASNE